MARREKIAVLGVNTFYEGDLEFKESLKIKGKYIGTINSEGTLYLEESSSFEGKVNVGRIVVSGEVVGDITAKEHIEVLDKSRIKGNLKAPVIRIADGVKIEGRCQMIQNSETIDIFSTSVNQLKKSVTIV